MKAKIMSDRLGEQIKGSIFMEANDNQKLVIRIPNSDESKGLPQISIYNLEEKFISGLVIPYGYDHIEITMEEKPTKHNGLCYITIPIKTGRIQLTGYIGDLCGVCKDAVTGLSVLWGKESKILRSFDIFISFSNNIPIDLGLVNIGKFQPGNEITPYYHVYVHQDYTEGLDDNED